MRTPEHERPGEPRRHDARDRLPFDAIDGLDADELRGRLRALRAVLEAAPVPIAIAHDPACRYISANRALARLLRLPPDANISLTPPEGEQPAYRIQREGRDIPAPELPMQQAISRRAAISNEIEIVRPDGSVACIQNDVEPLYDSSGNVYGCVSVCVDITDRKTAERVLREADRRKDEFLATLSHELRNPLAPLRGALEVMRRAGDDRDLLDRARETMERQLQHLVRLTDDLLDVARLTHGKMRLRRERSDLRTIVEGAFEVAREGASGRTRMLTLRMPPAPVWVDADPTRLAQVFSNLLNNALKFTPDGGAIQVRITGTASAATVSVEDSGVGIPQELVPSVFDMFAQLPRFRERGQGGLGIGLTLARRLVELHGGTLTAASEGEGRGSTFAVTLPTVAPPEAAVSPTAGAPPPAVVTPCRILLADDNPDTVEMMRLMFALDGHDVRVAGDGLVAVAEAERFRPRIAFLDIGMPRLDGYEAARRIRALMGRTVMLVALTGWGQSDDKARAREAGFDHHLTKPPEPAAMAELIAACAAERMEAPARPGDSVDAET